MSRNIAELIDGLEFFQEFPYRELETMAHYLGYSSLEAGQPVFNEGDPGSYMLILLDGKVSILKAGESGRHLLSYEGRGRIIGEMALLDRERRSATCIAETDCELLHLSQDNLQKLAADYPALAYRFMHSLARLLSRRLRRTSGILAEHLVC